MLPAYAALIGTAISFCSGLYYSYLTSQGATKPNRVTYTLWALFPTIIFTAQLVEGVGLVALATLVAGVPSLLTLLASYHNPSAYWRIRPRSYVFGVLAVLSIVLWLLADDPNVAIGLALLANAMAGIPTAIKAFYAPRSEQWRPYAISAVGFMIVFLSITEHTFANTAFVAYLMAANLIIAVLAFRQPPLYRTANTR